MLGHIAQQEQVPDDQPAMVPQRREIRRVIAGVGARAQADFQWVRARFGEARAQIGDCRQDLLQGLAARVPWGGAQDAHSRGVQAGDPPPGIEHHHPFAHLLDHGLARGWQRVEDVEAEQRNGIHDERKPDRQDQGV